MRLGLFPLLGIADLPYRLTSILSFIFFSRCLIASIRGPYCCGPWIGYSYGRPSILKARNVGTLLPCSRMIRISYIVLVLFILFYFFLLYLSRSFPFPLSSLSYFIHVILCINIIQIQFRRPLSLLALFTLSYSSSLDTLDSQFGSSDAPQ